MKPRFHTIFYPTIRLEALDFELVIKNAVFGKILGELAASKAKYGHDNLSTNYSGEAMMVAVKKIQGGKNTHSTSLQDEKGRLDALGLIVDSSR